jgi:hypothetical protein
MKILVKGNLIAKGYIAHLKTDAIQHSHIPSEDMDYDIEIDGNMTIDGIGIIRGTVYVTGNIVCLNENIHQK